VPEPVRTAAEWIRPSGPSGFVVHHPFCARPGPVSIPGRLWPRNAQYASECMQARLPTVGEYIYLSELGNWNGGVRSDKGLWALSQERDMAPEMPNPSIVRSIKEFQSPEIRYFCVRQVVNKKTTDQCAR
jgi:hypothetical protein